MKNPDGSLSPDEIGKIETMRKVQADGSIPAGWIPDRIDDVTDAVSYVLRVGGRRDSYVEFLNQRTVDEMRAQINAVVGRFPDEIVFKRHGDPPPETPKEKFKRQLLQYLKEKRDRDGSL